MVKFLVFSGRRRFTGTFSRNGGELMNLGELLNNGALLQKLYGLQRT